MDVGVVVGRVMSVRGAGAKSGLQSSSMLTRRRADLGSEADSKLSHSEERRLQTGATVDHPRWFCVTECRTFVPRASAPCT